MVNSYRSLRPRYLRSITFSRRQKLKDYELARLNTAENKK